MRFHTIVASCGYLGFSKIAPGTVGSLFTAIITFFVLEYSNIYVAMFLLILSITLGSYSTSRYLTTTKASDPQEVVVDEFAGQILAIIISYYFLQFVDLKIIIIANFLLFRLFDITKIFPVSYFDNIENTFGIMSDDVVAGLMAAGSFIGLYYILCLVVN